MRYTTTISRLSKTPIKPEAPANISSKIKSGIKPGVHYPALRLNQPAKMKLAIACALAQSLAMPSIGWALPAGADVQYGQASFQTQAQQLNINQTSQQLITNWQSFGIAANEAVNLTQPNQGVALFRVVGDSASQIFGQLNATGSLFLVNPNGVLFGQGAQIDVGSLTASTLNISNSDFLNQHYQFNAGANSGGVENQGVIRTADGGYIVLLGNTVSNSGSITANNGSVVLGAAQSAMLDFYGNGLVQARLSGDALNAQINQSGAITADGGMVQLATSARSAAINVTGVVQANSLVERNGVIRLEGGEHAQVAVSGTLRAAGEQANTTGGQINVSGEQVALLSDAELDASGKAGGGTVLVGGDTRGAAINDANTQAQSSRTAYVDQNAVISADATENGNGGKVVVWSEEASRFYGQISAKGGANTGNGGFVEVSARQHLDFIGGVDVGAANGLGGYVLIDPENIVLNNSTQSTPPNNANGTADIAFANAPAVGTTTIQISDIVGFSELFLQATNTITVANNIAMQSGNSIRLEANNDLNVNGEIRTFGTGSIRLTADADNSGAGTLAINQRLFSEQGDINLNGNNIISTSTGNILAQGAVGQHSGNIAINATNTINLAGTVVSNGRSGSAGVAGSHAGNISINANGDISATNISASGGNAGSGNTNSGNAGNINLATAGNITAGNITARTGKASGTGLAGSAGSISLAANNVTTAAINTAGDSNGAGGAINLTSNFGNINTGSINSTGGAANANTAGKNAGNIIINASGNVQTTTINANGSAANGANLSGGNAANINIRSSNAITTRSSNAITTTDVSASGGNGGTGNSSAGNAGAINMQSLFAGDIRTGALSARVGSASGTGLAGNVGSIDLSNEDGSIFTTNISTAGNNNGNGGNVFIHASQHNNINGSINTSGGGIATGNTAGGTGAGNITLIGINNSVTGAINANGGAALGVNQAGGSAGVVDISGAGAITTAAINVRNGNATGIGAGGNTGSVYLTGANINTAALTTAGNNNGAGGSLYLTANTADIVTTAINSNGGISQANTAGSNGGVISLNAARNIQTTAISANGSAGNGANQSGGNANTVTLTAAGAINTTTISAVAGNGGTGNANAGDGGSIVLSATGNGAINTTDLSARSGSASGSGAAGSIGNITISNNLGSVTTGILNTSGNTNGSGGNINVNTAGNIQTGAINSAGGAATTNRSGRSAGSVNVASSAANTTVGGISAAGSNGNGSNQNGGDGGVVTLAAGNAVAMSSINTSGGTKTGTAIGGAGGNISVANNALLLANTTINATGGSGRAGGTVTFSGDVNSAGSNRNLVISNNGSNIFNGAIGNNLALNSFNSDATGNTILNGGAVTTIASQIYSDDTTLGANTRFNTSNANVSFNNTINANGHAVSINAGSGTVTAANTGNDFNQLAIRAGTATIRDANAIVLGSTNINGNFSMRSGGAISQSNAVTVGGLASFNGNNGATDVVLNNAANDFNSVNFLARDVSMVDSNNLTITASSVRSILAQANNNLTLAGNISASANTGTPITLVAANFINAANYNLSTGAGGRWLVYSSNPANDTRGANLTNAAKFKQYNTAYGEAILGSGNGFVYSLAPTITLTLSGTASKIYDGLTSAPINGLTLSQTGAVDGDTVNLSAFTTASFDNKNAGAGKTVTSNNFTILNASNGSKTVYGYQLNSANTSANIGEITPRAVTVSAVAETKIYDATTNANALPNISSGSVASGDTAQFSQVFDSANAGTAKTLTAYGNINDGNGGSNYALTFVDNNAGVITPRPVTITVDAGQSKVLGAADPAVYTYAIGGLGLVGTDTLTGALARQGGEVAGNYAINQANLDAGSNYTINYIGNVFSIVDPNNNANPSQTAGLGGILSFENATQNVAVVNVGETAAGGDAEVNAESCESNADKKVNRANTVLMLNFGLKLPKGVKPTCI